MTVGTSDGEVVSRRVGVKDGGEVGDSVVSADGANDGVAVGASDGEVVSRRVGTKDGVMLGRRVGDSVGNADGANDGVVVGNLAGDEVRVGIVVVTCDGDTLGHCVGDIVGNWVGCFVASANSPCKIIGPVVLEILAAISLLMFSTFLLRFEMTSSCSKAS